MFPAETSWLPRPTGADYLTVGDAALAWDPASGRGIVKSLELAAAAASAISGETEVAAYEERIRTDFRTYRRRRQELYGLERRWPDAPFWARRHAE